MTTATNSDVSTQMRTLLLLTFAAVFLAGLSRAEAADATLGEAVFKSCAACHSLKPGQNKVGPSLHGVIGRVAGSAERFNYSPAMRKADHVWTAETLDAYLADPKAFVPGNRMPFPGIRDEAKRADLIAYLQSVTD